MRRPVEIEQPHVTDTNGPYICVKTSEQLLSMFLYVVFFKEDYVESYGSLVEKVVLIALQNV